MESSGITDASTGSVAVTGAGASISHENNTSRADRSDSAENEASFQDAVAVSSALVGENVVDSPQQRRSPRKLVASTAAQILGAPGLHDEDDHANGNSSSPHIPQTYKATSSSSTRLPEPPQPPLLSDDANAMSVGLMAQGLSWARRQRERRKRLYLQNQAEQQMLKIRAAEEAEKQQKEGRSLLDNPTCQNMLSSSSSNKNLSSLSSQSAADKSSDGTDTKHNDLTSTSVSKSGDGISMVLASYAATKTRQEEDAAWIPPVRLVEEDDHETLTSSLPILCNKLLSMFCPAALRTVGGGGCTVWHEMETRLRVP